jgi:hypothetical protein
MWEPAARTPAARIKAVVSFSRRGVIQLGVCVAIQARMPVAAAPLTIAVAMHCMHMAARLAPQSKGGSATGTGVGEGAGYLSERFAEEERSGSGGSLKTFLRRGTE